MKNNEKGVDNASKVVFDTNAQCCDIMNHLIKEETMEETIKIDIPKGYEFAVVDNDNKIVLTKKKQSQYPKNFIECAIILNCFNTSYFDGYKNEILEKLQELIICRDAYWKIAGEQMGLGKPWEPNDCQIVYSIGRDSNRISLCNDMFGGYFILEFPTNEMRDAFFENFKDLIDACKELL